MGLEFQNILTINTMGELGEFVKGELFKKILSGEIERLSITCLDNKFPPILINFNPKKGYYGDPPNIFIQLIDTTVSTMAREATAKKFKELFPAAPLYPSGKLVSDMLDTSRFSPIPRIIGKNDSHIVQGVIESIIRQLLNKGFVVEIGKYRH